MSAPSIASFGYKQHPQDVQALDQKYMRVSQCVQMCEVVTAISTIALATLVTCCLITSGVGAGIFLGLGVIILILSTYQDYLSLARICQQAGATDQAFTPTPGECHVLATTSSTNTMEWRIACIKAAKESIVVSGNYCGGTVFLNLLQTIKAQIEENPALKVVILSSPHFLKGESQRTLNTLLRQYPQNISLVSCPLIWHISSSPIKLTTNHTKCMVIDQGRYFILGGSNLTDQFQDTGKYRDQDWVFSDETGAVGRQLYRQMLLLAHRWESINEASPSLTQQLLKTMHDGWPGLLTTLIPDLENHDDLAKDSNCHLLISGPEQPRSLFAQEVLDKIQGARLSVDIDHMYFHPTDEIMSALVEAANQGVKIRVITCGLHPQAPATHSLFAPHNRANYTLLMQKVRKENRQNVEIYEFDRPQQGLHKKLIVIDREIVIAGSSNLGYKSLVTSSDHEVNFVVTSQKIGETTLQIFQEDIEMSCLIIPPNRVEWSLRAPLHRWLGFLIG